MDPTYIRTQIEANPIWKLAFWMSEIANDHAPIGWGHYIPIAQALINQYDLKEKEPRTAAGSLD